MLFSNEFGLSDHEISEEGSKDAYCYRFVSLRNGKAGWLVIFQVSLWINQRIKVVKGATGFTIRLNKLVSTV